MGFPVKDYRQIRADILRDIGNLQPAASVGSDSDFYVRATGTGGAAEGLYQHQQWIARQILASTSDSDWLEAHAAERGTYRKPAAFATGTPGIIFDGTPGAAVTVGTEAKSASGIAFVTTAADVIGAGGTVSIAAKASVAGAAGNLTAGTALTLTAAPSGVLSNASIVSMTGGADVESDTDLLTRYLVDLRLPPCGGAKHDYSKWAMEVAGVTDVYVFTQRRNTRSVDVVIEAAGGLPSAQLIADTLAHIDTQRPPCADVLVMAPELVPVAVTGALVLSGITLADATAKINLVLQAYFKTLHVGDVVRKTKLETLITGVSGVLDVALSAPAANVQPLADATHSQLASLGVVTLT